MPKVESNSVPRKRFVVQARSQFWTAALFAVGGWGVILSPLAPHRQRHVADLSAHPMFDGFALGSYYLLFCLFFPLLALITSYRLDVTGDQIEVRKYLGLIRRQYSRSDIVDFRFSPATKTWYSYRGARIALAFIDGVRLVVTQPCSGFDDLLTYCGRLA